MKNEGSVGNVALRVVAMKQTMAGPEAHTSEPCKYTFNHSCSVLEITPCSAHKLLM